MNPVTNLISKFLNWRHRHFVAGGNRFRERRLRFFIETLVRERERVLDVGYGYGQFEDQMFQFGVESEIIALDITSRDTSGHPNIMAFVVADAANLPFADRSLDIIYCNSILEHVGDRQVQQRVFVEIERVGCKFFVQTPNRHFPIEAHHLLPFFQYLPRSVQRWVGQNILGHYEQTWLLDRRDVKELVGVGGGIAVWEEKVLGLTKSFVLYRNHPLGQRG